MTGHVNHFKVGALTHALQVIATSKVLTGACNMVLSVHQAQLIVAESETLPDHVIDIRCQDSLAYTRMCNHGCIEERVPGPMIAMRFRVDDVTQRLVQFRRSV